MNRRAFLASSAASATAVTLNAAVAATEGPFGETGVPLAVPPSERLPLGPLSGSRYPDPHIEAVDKKRFKGSVGTGAVERVATGFRWAEGPAYFRAGRYLVFSDIPNNRIMRLLEDDNHLSVFRSPSINSNGNTVDPRGPPGHLRAQRPARDAHRARRHDHRDRRQLQWQAAEFAERCRGGLQRFDLVHRPDIRHQGQLRGTQAEPEQEKHNVYRVDGKTGDVTVVVDDFVQPNGLAFSPDEKRLYVIDTGFTDGGPAHIRVFDVDIDTGKVSNGKVFAEGFAPGITDGVRCDVEGNVWCSMGWADPKEDGVRCYSPEGDLLGKIHIPETVANLTFGGLLRNRLYICGSTSLYACYVDTQGALKP